MNRLFFNFSKVNKLLDSNVSIYLDFIRGLSAILVVMEHLSSRLFVGYGNVENPNILVSLLYMLNILGGPAVIIFFVLSGLFISRSVLKALYEEKWSWKTYLINRLSRLMVVLVPALLLTLVLDIIAVKFFEYEGYTNAYMNLKNFVGNLFFLQNVYVDVYGSNAPLWSLNYEFWYYILFPILLLLILNKRKVAKLFYFLSAILIISTVGVRMSTYFVIWLIGTSILLLPKTNLLKHRLFPIMSFALLLIVLPVRPLVMTGRLFTNQWTENLFIVDLLIGLVFGFFIYSLLHVTSNSIRNIEFSWFGGISKRITAFSFSLYLIHYPIINTVYYWGAKNGFSGLQPNLGSIAIEFLLIIFICMIAFYFSRITEAQTYRVRRFLKGKTNSNRDQENKQNLAG
ncbi:acyltransferase family protein [Fictibacillus barbaricus]|uniref:Peptidoglycan/LPS O-acetylase OafA/YrhL n=1 Tax=Fictibacillus barbaricus TaxID=182136 RepID=A0ABU1U1K2_9BACL|nr:acyltransferase [Fictibacillus barbaricus]MDR7073346.1 peptidoglycan/LPS O-acetylase OafA/YrhL [Fictibacillus barbaricus]